jgi:putative FmdB family regulatory protein
MPLYEYQCAACRKVHEVMQKFSDAPLEKCPECQGPVQKIVSLSSFALKGSGWYTTDYKRASQAPATSPAAPSEKASPTAEPKPAASTPAPAAPAAAAPASSTKPGSSS